MKFVATVTQNWDVTSTYSHRSKRTVKTSIKHSRLRTIWSKSHMHLELFIQLILVILSKLPCSSHIPSSWCWRALAQNMFCRFWCHYLFIYIIYLFACKVECSVVLYDVNWLLLQWSPSLMLVLVKFLFHERNFLQLSPLKSKLHVRGRKGHVQNIRLVSNHSWSILIDSLAYSSKYFFLLWIDLIVTINSTSKAETKYNVKY